MKQKRVSLALLLAGVAVVGAGVPVYRALAAEQAAASMTRNGHPDLSGFWNGGNPGTEKKSDDAPQYYTRDGTLDSFENDGQVLARANVNRPVYKPQYWDKIRDLDWHNGRQTDPNFSCNASFPRANQVPQAIIQNDNFAVIIYSEANTRRIVPLDGRPHNKDRALDQTWYGDSVGHWEGDTLVIDTVGFNEESWLKNTGYIHTNEMHAVERIRREGDVLHYQVTVDDPMLMEPWKLTDATLRLNKEPDATVVEEAPCEERSGALAAKLDPLRGE